MATLRAMNASQGAGARGAVCVRRASRTRRLSRTVLEVVALGVIAALLIAAPFLSRSRAGHYETGTVLTAPGDTLWTLAQEHPIPGLSTAEAVEVIASLNSLQDTVLPVGVAVEVPSSAQNGAVALR